MSQTEMTQHRRRWLGRLLGERLPLSTGRLQVPGIESSIWIGRDRYGVPHIQTKNEADAWFALGFCQAQDRGFQLEILLRLGRGTLAAMVGNQGIAVDRLSRRIGFFRAGQAQKHLQPPDVLQSLEAFASGINAGFRHGIRRRPHELALLFTRPSTWTVEDVLAGSKLTSFFLSTNWDTELARLKVLEEDGEQALRDLEPAYRADHPVSSPPGAAAGPAVDRLSEELIAARRWLGTPGASNHWAVGPERTQNGKVLLANDPHLNPAMPNQFYLAHLMTPSWEVVGASFVGAPGIAAGHNGHMAWGVTSGMADQTDLFLESLGSDGKSVRRGDSFEACQVLEESIQVRGGKTIRENILVTSHGPVISPALEGESRAFSLSAAWLAPQPIRGFLTGVRCADFHSFRAEFQEWAGPCLNVLYGDVEGKVGWFYVGRVPRRKKGFGLLPKSGADPQAGWEETPIPFEELPWTLQEGDAVVATANNRPVPEGEGPFLGAEWTQGYRAARIHSVLRERSNWSRQAFQELQMDTFSLPFAELKDTLLEIEPTEKNSRVLSFLRSWDGMAEQDSIGASVFELFLAEMTERIARSKAPKTWLTVLGQGIHRLAPFNQWAVRRTPHTVQLLLDQPEDTFANGWGQEMAEALEQVQEGLDNRFGPDEAGWAWGKVRPLRLMHPLSKVNWLHRFFGLGPFSWAGSSSTIAMATSDPADPTANPIIVATFRMVVEAGAWDEARFVLAGGQSGNPCSPHFDDQLNFWKQGQGIPVAWGWENAQAAVQMQLDLDPV